MTHQDESSYPLKKRTVVGFLVAALATYIPIAAFAVIFMDAEYLWSGGTHPPPPGNEMAGFGAALVLFIFGPLCSLVAGVAGAFLVGYRRNHLGSVAFGILVAVSLVIVAVSVLVFTRVLPFEL
jgi:hypothetical protein